MRLISALCFLSVSLWAVGVRADACDDKCAPAKAAVTDAEARATKLAEDAKTGKAQVEVQQQEVARVEKTIADAKQAKTDALNELAKPRTKRRRAPDAQKLAQAVKDADQAIEEGIGKLEAARAALRKAEDAAKTLDDAAGRANADADAARKANEDCRAKCASGAPVAKPAAPEAPQEDAPSAAGISVGARLAVGLPFGAVQEGSAIGDRFAALLPLQLDAGWRFSPRFYLGAYFQYGVIFRAKDACPNTTSCSSTEMRFGVNAEYRFVSPASATPWIGFGAGYEVSMTSATLQGGGDQSGSIQGFEFAHLEGGVDFHAKPRLAWGPFLSLSLGEYSHGSDLGGLSGLRFHEWAMLGVRGRFEAM